MIDTHTHLYLEEFADEGIGQAVRRAVEAGVSQLIFPNVDASTIEPLLKLHEAFPDTTVYAMGLHPTEVREDWRDVVESMRRYYDDEKCVAVGEVGIDLYWDTTYRALQIEAFREQLRIARMMELPVIIHCREALNDVLASIEAEDMGNYPLVFHSFTGTADDVRRILNVAKGAMFGINGVVTFKKAEELRKALPVIGLSRLLPETDSPYLAPVPHRGKRNESAYLGAVCSKVAEVLGMSVEEVEQATDANARCIFKL